MQSFSLFKQPYEFKLELSQRLSKIRKSQGFSQQELARRSNVSLGSVKRFEQKGEISLHHLLEIALILGVLDDFDLLFQTKHDLISDKVRKAFEDNE
jgi:transcriptional regulator with XRE-family HTH domain